MYNKKTGIDTERINAAILKQVKLAILTNPESLEFNCTFEGGKDFFRANITGHAAYIILELDPTKDWSKHDFRQCQNPEGIVNAIIFGHFIPWIDKKEVYFLLDDIGYWPVHLRDEYINLRDSDDYCAYTEQKRKMAELACRRIDWFIEYGE